MMTSKSCSQVQVGLSDVFVSKFSNNCVTTPVCPISRLPWPLYERWDARELSAVADDESCRSILSVSVNDEIKESETLQHPILCQIMNETDLDLKQQPNYEILYYRLLRLKKKNELYLSSFADIKFLNSMDVTSKREKLLNSTVLDVKDTRIQSKLEEINSSFPDMNYYEDVDDVVKDKQKVTKKFKSEIFGSKKSFTSTVPQPFQMTIRYEDKLNEKINEISKETEDNNQVCKPPIFKAKSVPRSVMEPRFKQLIETDPQRFGSFLKVIHRSKSTSNIRSIRINENRANFKATPFPAQIFTDLAYEKQREEENYREIRRKMRVAALLRITKAASMNKTTEMTKTKELNKVVESDQSKDFKIRFYPVPNFRKLHEDFNKRMEIQKSCRHATLPKPFSFTINDNNKKNSPAYKRPNSAFEVLVPTERVKKAPSSKKEIDNIVRTNKTSNLRAVSNRQKLQQWKADEAAKKQRAQSLIQKQKIIRFQSAIIASESENNIYCTVNQQRKRDILEHSMDRKIIDQERVAEYKLQLLNIKERIKRRPLLVEICTSNSMKKRIS